MFTIYMATNQVNGKRYIGFTGKGMPHRRKAHLANARNGRKDSRLYAAIRKYGADAFAWSVIAEFSDRAEALHHEFVLVAALGNEYNAKPGGIAPPVSIGWNKRSVICLEDGKIFESAKAAARHYKVDFSDVSKACKGLRRNVVSDKHFQFYVGDISEDERRAAIGAMDAAAVKKRARGRVAPIEPPAENGRDKLGRSAAGPMTNARQVVCVDDGRSFESVSAAAHYYGVCKSALIELCRGQKFRKTVGGKRFAYAEAA